MRRFQTILILAVVFASIVHGCANSSSRTSDKYSPDATVRGAEKSKSASKSVNDSEKAMRSNHLLRAGIDAEGRGDFPAAESAYLKCLSFNKNYKVPKNSGIVYHRLGVVTAQMEDFTKSEEYFTLAMQSNQDDVELLCDYAQMLNEQERYHEAEIVLKNALLIDPNSQKVQYFLGCVLGFQEHYQLGLRYLRRSLGEVDALRELAQIYRRNGEDSIARSTDRKVAILLEQEQERMIARNNYQGGSYRMAMFQQRPQNSVNNASNVIQNVPQKPMQVSSLPLPEINVEEGFSMPVIPPAPPVIQAAADDVSDVAIKPMSWGAGNRNFNPVPAKVINNEREIVWNISENNFDIQYPTSVVPEKTAEVKPIEVKPIEVKPIEVKPIEVKPAEMKSAESTPPKPMKVETSTKRIMLTPLNIEVMKYHMEGKSSENTTEEQPITIRGQSPEPIGKKKFLNIPLPELALRSKTHPARESEVRHLDNIVQESNRSKDRIEIQTYNSMSEESISYTPENIEPLAYSVPPVVSEKQFRPAPLPQDYASFTRNQPTENQKDLQVLEFPEFMERLEELADSPEYIVSNPVSEPNVEASPVSRSGNEISGSIRRLLASQYPNIRLSPERTIPMKTETKIAEKINDKKNTENIVSEIPPTEEIAMIDLPLEFHSEQVSIPEESIASSDMPLKTPKLLLEQPPIIIDNRLRSAGMHAKDFENGSSGGPIQTVGYAIEKPKTEKASESILEFIVSENKTLKNDECESIVWKSEAQILIRSK